MQAPQFGFFLDAAGGEFGHPLFDPDPVDGAEILNYRVLGHP
jgi:hypothetical protein